MEYKAHKGFAEGLDRRDPLGMFRSRFQIPLTPQGQEVIYFCGNSLGLQPKNVADHVGEVVAAWRELAVEGHFHGKNPWWTYHDHLIGPTARLAGAMPVEVTLMNALTMNLHLLMVSFYRPTPERHRILIEGRAFPSDQYAVKSQIAWHGYNAAESLLEVKPRPGEDCIRTADIESLLAREGKTIALVLLGGVHYYTGQAFRMDRISRAARTYGCVVGYDLAHAIGNVPLALHNWDVDFAAWCTYKYLNGGPGATGGCFVHERHARSFDLSRFAGWWGHDRSTRFRMGPDFHPIPGAEGWQVSNLPVLQLAALRPSLEMFDEAGFERLREKSVALTGYLEYLLRGAIRGECSIVTPPDKEERGCQLSIQVGADRKPVFERLLALGVVCDWREPDVIRVAPVPLYNTFVEVYEFVERFRIALRG